MVFQRLKCLLNTARVVTIIPARMRKLPGHTVMSEEQQGSDLATPPTTSAGDAEAVHMEKIALSGQAEQEAYPYDQEAACWSMVSLQAPAFEPTERASIDIVTVVDKSGSMSGEKISLVRETLHFVVDQRES